MPYSKQPNYNDRTYNSIEYIINSLVMQRYITQIYNSILTCDLAKTSYVTEAQYSANKYCNMAIHFKNALVELDFSHEIYESFVSR